MSLYDLWGYHLPGNQLSSTACLCIFVNNFTYNLVIIDMFEHRKIKTYKYL